MAERQPKLVWHDEGAQSYAVAKFGTRPIQVSIWSTDSGLWEWGVSNSYVVSTSPVSSRNAAKLDFEAAFYTAAFAVIEQFRPGSGA